MIGIVEKLDPRTKLFLTVLYAVWVVSAGGVLRLIWASIFLMVFIASVRELKAYVGWLRLVLPMSLFFGAVIWWTITLDAAVFAALKLLVLTSTFFAFFTTTAPEDLANALVKVGMPYAIAFVVSTSLQFVPIMGRKAKNVLDAQRARGIPLEPGWSAVRNYPAFLAPILIQAFQMAEELAEAMEARGFGLPGRTFLKEYRMGVTDWIAIAAGIVLLAGVFIVT